MRRPALLSTLALLLVAACGSTQRPDGGEGLLEVGSVAPEFEARDQSGQLRRLSSLRGGSSAVLFFYPRDSTPGCTREACAFRDAWDRFEAAGAAVIGVSTDDVESHARFAEEHALRFPLIADPSGEILRAYGVSSTLGMASRVTFVIGSDGRVRHVFPDVDPAVHVDEVLAALR